MVLCLYAIFYVRVSELWLWSVFWLYWIYNMMCHACFTPSFTYWLAVKSLILCRKKERVPSWMQKMLLKLECHKTRQISLSSCSHTHSCTLTFCKLSFSPSLSEPKRTKPIFMICYCNCDSYRQVKWTFCEGKGVWKSTWEKQWIYQKLAYKTSRVITQVRAKPTRKQQLVY